MLTSAVSVEEAERYYASNPNKPLTCFWANEEKVCHSLEQAREFFYGHVWIEFHQRFLALVNEYFHPKSLSRPPHPSEDEKDDPYFTLKEAQKHGFSIEKLSGDKWLLALNPKWDSPPHHYRVREPKRDLMD